MPNAPEARYDCPVCVGLPMQKLKITQENQRVVLTLDCCRRCGGVWFDKNEVQLSKQISSPNIHRRILQIPKRWMSHCQQCNGLMDRNLKNCSTCGWQNQVNCPVCEKVLQRKQHKNLILDVCQGCQGVWFDQIELLHLWNDASVKKLSPNNQGTADTTPQNRGAQVSHHGPQNIVHQAVADSIVDVSANSMLSGVDIVEPGMDLLAHAAGNTAKGTAEAVAQAPELAGGTVEALAEVTGAALETTGELLPEVATVMLEVTGEVAGSMVSVLAEVIAGLFSGL